MQINNGESPLEFFGYTYYPFADTYRLKTPYIAEQDQRFYKTALSLIHTGKSFDLTGQSGAGKSTLIHHFLASLDANCYKPAKIHYGGLQRNGMLKAIEDVIGVDTRGRDVPLLVKLQKQIMQMASEKRSMFPVFAIDDAHLMEMESLMDICSLMFNPARETVAASFILVGDESFGKRLELQSMASVKTRLRGIKLSFNKGCGSLIIDKPVALLFFINIIIWIIFFCTFFTDTMAKLHV